MSNAKNYETLIASTLTSKIPAYTQYTDWVEGGLPASNAVQFAVYYVTEDEETDGRAKVGYRSTIYIQREYEEIGDSATAGDEAKEQLRTDFEKFIGSSTFKFAPDQEFSVLDQRNAKTKIKYIQFDIILN